MKEDGSNYNNEFLRYLKSTLPEYKLYNESSKDLYVYIEVYEIHGGPDSGHIIHLSYFDMDIPDAGMSPTTLKLGRALPHYEEFIRLKRSKKLEDLLSDVE